MDSDNYKIKISKPGKAREQNRSAEYLNICKQDFGSATPHGDEILILRGSK
jgi:hypothetical protein